MANGGRAAAERFTRNPKVGEWSPAAKAATAANAATAAKAAKDATEREGMWFYFKFPKDKFKDNFKLECLSQTIII